MEKPKLSLEETLLPALVQCFGIIFIGYILGKTKILHRTQAQGLSIFVQYLSLPALIFVTVSTIPFTQIKWEFIASVFVSKTCIFLFVALITMLLTHPHDLGKAGIFAISATQSNDFALGYPLFIALYQTTHPEYPIYLYIIAPIQLLILNTIGFFLLEVEKHTQSTIKKENYLYHVLKGTLRNPVVIMTIVGLIWNVTYGQKVLPIFDNILKAFSSAFPATALLLVGYTMTTVTSQKSNSQISLSVILLIICKNLIFPLILQKLSGFMLQKSSAKEIQNFSSFGFLYGTIPTAPTAYVFATQYNTGIDVVTKTVIGSTLISAPLMFASASVISLAQVGIENASFYLSVTISYLSCINISSCIWLLLLFLTGKRWRSISLGITFYLVLAQFLMATGGILLFTSQTDYSALFCAQYILTTGSTYATRMCTFLLAILLLIIRIRSLCFILQIKRQINTVTMICFIIPYVLAASLLFCKNENINGPNFQLGFVQVITTFVLTLLCLVGTIICVIMQQVYLKKNINSNQELNSNPSQNSLVDEFLNSPSVTCIGHQATTSKTRCTDIEDMGKSLSNENCFDCDNSAINDISDKICDSRYQCSAAKRLQCSTEVSRYINENNQIGTGLIDDEYFCKHIILLIILGVAMTLNLFVCFWKLLMEAINGIFIELEFLDVIVNYSLGVVYFIIFGLDSKLVNSICAKLKFVKARAPLASDSKDICDQFLSQHYQICREEIEQCKIINGTEHFNIFVASDLANWLLETGVADTDEEAKFHFECLLNAHIIEKLGKRDESSNYINLYKFPNLNCSINV